MPGAALIPARRSLTRGPNGMPPEHVTDEGAPLLRTRDVASSSSGFSVRSILLGAVCACACVLGVMQAVRVVSFSPGGAGFHALLGQNPYGLNKELAPERVTLVAACALVEERAPAFQTAIQSWAAAAKDGPQGKRSFDRVVIVDWSSEANLWQQVLNFWNVATPLDFFRVQDANGADLDWVLSKAYNFGFDKVTTDVILKVDCDTFVARLEAVGKRPNPNVYSSLMGDLCAAGQPDRALELLGQMRAAGVTPSNVTLTVLLSSLLRANAVGAALDLANELREAQRERAIQYDLPLYNTILQALLAGNAFGAYVCYGVALIFSGQAFVNMGVSSGLLPTKGLTLPFVSYGGTSLIVCCAMLALVLRVERETRPQPRRRRQR